MTQRTNPFEGAKCDPEKHAEWNRQHHASQWDFKVDNETDLEARRRRAWAVALCNTCPVRGLCREAHAEASKKDPYRTYAPGVWAGGVYPDTEPEADNTAAPLPFEDMAA